jgi:hypothetical protein
MGSLRAYIWLRNLILSMTLSLVPVWFILFYSCYSLGVNGRFSLCWEINYVNLLFAKTRSFSGAWSCTSCLSWNQDGSKHTDRTGLMAMVWFTFTVLPSFWIFAWLWIKPTLMPDIHISIL